MDVDGVLNAFGLDLGTPSTRIRYRCVKALNRIVARTDARVVISSAWRYSILCGAMTVAGWEIMLRSHGSCGVRVIGHTASDEDLPGRGRQIRHWLNEYGGDRKYVVIDDDDDGITEAGHPLVQTDPDRGLTGRDATKAIKLLCPDRALARPQGEAKSDG